MKYNGYQIICESVDTLDLSRYEKMYSKFDFGHDMDHVKGVRNFAVILAKKYLPEKVRLAYISATLHDIGLSKGREDHEINGAKMVLNDKYLKQQLTKEELNEIAHSIGQHRSSTGQPESILAKIISDADRSSGSSGYVLYRSIMYGIGSGESEGKSLEWQIQRAISHIIEKYGVTGKGRRNYFPETAKHSAEIYDPIIKLKNDQNRIKKAWNLIEQKLQKRILKELS